MGQAPLGEACNKDGLGTIFVKAGEFQERFPIIREWTTKPLKLSKAGDTLVCVVGATAGKINYSSFDCAIGRSVAAVRPDDDRVDSLFLFHFLQTKVKELRDRSQGAAQGVITREMLQSLSLILPPLSEQRRIAAILDQADALRAKRREALAQLDSLTQSIFIEMFGDPIANSRKWQHASMAEVVEGQYGIKAGPFGSSLKKDEYTSSGYRIYGQEQVIAGRFDIGDYFISERKFEQLKSCAVAEGDLLVSLVGSFGKVLIVPSGIEPGIINPRLLKVTPNQKLVTSRFLASLLQQPSVQAYFGRVAHGGTMGILNVGLLKQLEVILPPLESQEKFAQRISALDGLIDKHNQSFRDLDCLFASLQFRAFRGTF